MMTITRLDFPCPLTPEDRGSLSELRCIRARQYRQRVANTVQPDAEYQLTPPILLNNTLEPEALFLLSTAYLTASRGSQNK